MIIPVFSLQTEGLISGTNHWQGAGDTADDRRVRQIVSGYWSTTDKEIEMFPVSLAVCVSNEAAMQKAVSETNGSVQDTEAAMRGDASVTEACEF